MVWMAGLLAVAVAGAFVLPRVFAGYAVLSPRLDAEAAAPLSFTASNTAQAAYLMLNAGLLWWAAQTGGDNPATAEAAVRRVVAATYWTGAFVMLLAAYQFAASVAHLPYPDDVLYSNASYSMQSGTKVMDLPRLCSTFTEPAAMAVYGVGYLMFLAAAPPPPAARAAVGRGVLVVLTLAVLVLSTSSTALIGLAGAAAWAVARFVAWPLVIGRPNRRAIAALVAVAALLVAAYALSPTVQELVRQMVLEKNESSSYDERAGADAFAMQLVGHTWGAGVGLGSNRGSSFGPSLLSTVGVYGAAALAGLIVQLLRPAARGPARQFHPPLAAALVGVVGTKMVSSPDLVTPSMWTAMAALIAVQGAADRQPAPVAFEVAFPQSVPPRSTSVEAA